MKQTAVEWLAEQIEQYSLTHGSLPLNALNKFKKQAQKMMESQLKECWTNGFSFESEHKNFKDYYNKTYGK